MVNMFSENASLEQRAVQIWQILVGMAHTRRTTTYKELATFLGYAGAGVLGRQLGHIMFFCSQNNLPALTVLVVNSETGLPGEGLEIEGDIHQEREVVFKHNWYAIIPPSTNDYTAAWEAADNNRWDT